MEKQTYEEALKELTQIIEKIEKGQVSLDESLLLIERGKELVVFCNNSLSSAKGKLTEIEEILGKLEEI